MFVEILSTDNLKSIAIYEFVCIQKGTLSAVLLWTEGRSCKVYDFFKRLPLSKKTFA